MPSHKPSSGPHSLVKPTAHPTTKPSSKHPTVHPTTKSKSVQFQNSAARTLLASSEDISPISGLQFETLIAITSLPIGTTTLSSDLRKALAESVDQVLSLPSGSTSYVGDSLFTAQQKATDGVTLVAHVLTGVSLSTYTETEEDSSNLFNLLRAELSKSASSGNLLEAFQARTNQVSAISFGHSITSINMAVFTSSATSRSLIEDTRAESLILDILSINNPLFLSVAILFCVALLVGISMILFQVGKAGTKGTVPELDILVTKEISTSELSTKTNTPPVTGAKSASSN